MDPVFHEAVRQYARTGRREHVDSVICGKGDREVLHVGRGGAQHEDSIQARIGNARILNHRTRGIYFNTAGIHILNGRILQDRPAVVDRNPVADALLDFQVAQRGGAMIHVDHLAVREAAVLHDAPLHDGIRRTGIRQMDLTPIPLGGRRGVVRGEDYPIRIRAGGDQCARFALADHEARIRRESNLHARLDGQHGSVLYIHR